ncbi:multisubunit sodium/proton antiporter MrpD subunit [Crenobacter luteus]|uniref:proton-conducting transporter transmembrane domain-containing protein n=1 Tax=Crenobacter luteus TaxID=1452487 RepID=UPI00104A1F17|nr:proton-conducting transporter membrane subunit [Crenobacter luteus]TCP13027.1 multisubunit sodium/proton antiporter MrpD subunit [Crenobacter luteus]
MNAVLLLTALPVLWPMLTMLACIACAGRSRWQEGVAFAGAVGFVAITVALLAGLADGAAYVAHFGDWPAGFAIAFRIDRLGAAMLAVSALVLLAVLLYPARVDASGPVGPWSRPLLFGLMTGVGGAFSSADLFNLYVWFEVMLIAALGLLVQGGRAAHFEAGFKYLVLNLVGTVWLLVAVGGLYGVAGQLGFGQLAAVLPGSGQAALVTVFVALLLLALLSKAAAFPLFFWLPAAYPALPTPLLALFAGLLTKVGAYGVMRVVGEIAVPVAQPLLPALGWLAVLTMLAGVLGAAWHWDMRRVLAFHIISQIGYILLGVALGSVAGLAAALFYTLHHIVVKANLFLIGGLMRRCGGSFDLRRSGGLSVTRPALALLFALPAASLVGVPLTSGFWAKYLLVRACFAQGAYAWGGVALLVGALTLYSMSKVWIEAFWRRPEAPAAAVVPLPWRAWVACGALAAITLAIGVYPQTLIAFAEAAVADLALPNGGGR